MHRALSLLFLFALVFLVSALPTPNPGPIIEANTVYVRQEIASLAARNPAEGIDLAKRSPVLSWTWFNGGKKVKRDPVLSWTWFNGGKKVKREPVLSWTWFNGGRKE